MDTLRDHPGYLIMKVEIYHAQPFALPAIENSRYEKARHIAGLVSGYVITCLQCQAASTVFMLSIAFFSICLIRSADTPYSSARSDSVGF